MFPVEQRRLVVYDTTLRDGEQAPGFAMKPEGKVRFAAMLERLGVDVIEAGFPASSEGDWHAVDMIARTLRDTEICALARAVKKDIDTAARALGRARKPRLHVFIATSDIHMNYQLKKERFQVIEEAVEAVRYARSFADNVQFSAMDATRTDREFLADVYSHVIDAGAATVNISDTVGYVVPSEFCSLITFLGKKVRNIERSFLSVHCHNDLGLATANTITAVQSGVAQVEVTVNGIGERAGNASLQEVIRAIDANRNIINVETGIDMDVFDEASRLLHEITAWQ